MVISIASALLLARGGTQGATDLAVFSQLGKHPSALATVAVLMIAFGLFPGLPFVPFMLGGIALAIAAYLMYRKQRLEAVTKQVLTPEESLPREKSLGDILELDDIHVEFAPDLVNMVLDPGTGLDARISKMRTHVASVFGLILPEIRLTDHSGLPMGT